MAMDIEAAFVSVLAPPHLADAIIGDLRERRAALAQSAGDKKAFAIYRADAIRSLPSLAAHCAWQALAQNWTFALTAAAVICALCVAAIPLWDRLGFAGFGYHVLRLAVIGLILGRIPRASSLSCAFLLLLIGISNCAIDTRDNSVWRVLSGGEFYYGLLVDGVAMGSALLMLRTVTFIRALRLYST
jgi:hypothetical protein